MEAKIWGNNQWRNTQIVKQSEADWCSASVLTREKSCWLTVQQHNSLGAPYFISESFFLEVVPPRTEMTENSVAPTLIFTTEDMYLDGYAPD